MKSLKSLVFGPLLLALACGGGAGSEGAKTAERTKDNKFKFNAAAEKAHNDALDEFVAHDKAGDWTEASCRSVAEKFIAASDANDDPLPTSLYNAGVAYMRCGLEEDALSQFQAASADPKFHRGRAQLALFEYKKTGNVDGTIAELEQIIRDAKFQNVEALISVAALQMERNSDQATDDGANDFDRAKKNIQRALAIDDSFMPAFNQLAIYYMEMAKKKAGRSNKRGGLTVAGSKRAAVNQQQLELAALVASQALLKNGKYAPIHNTAGLIQVEMDNYNGAVKSFAQARSLDPRFFEAHMNYAALNLSFRGFKEAESAYRDALKLQPGDYEGHLGLALALRGQIEPGETKLTEEAQKHLEECKKIDPSRAEAFYNEAILTHEYRTKSEGDALKSIPLLEKAVQEYEVFVGKAGGEERYAEAVKVSQDRVQDIRDTIQFIKDGEEARVQQEEMDRQMKAEEEAMKKADEEAKKAEEDAKKAEAAKKAEEAKKATPAPAAPAAAAPKKGEEAKKAPAATPAPAAPKK